MERKQKYLLYALSFVVLIIIITVVGTYAFFKVSTTKSTTLGSVGATTECVDVSYSETGTISLDYNYPITDSFALSNIVPITVKVTNNCTTNNLNYTLALSSLSNSTGFITDDKIRMNVKRKIGSASETTLFSNDYLSYANKLMNSTTYKYITNYLNENSNTSSYLNKKPYVIDNNTIAKNSTNEYKIYLWVDYYEGDELAYSGSAHDSSYDNTTTNKNFKVSINLVVNSSSEVSEYKAVKYIESSGGQYINTEYVPNNNSRVVLDYENGGTSLAALFGARVQTTNSVFGLWLSSTEVNPHWANNSYDVYKTTISANKRMIYDMNKNSFTIGDSTSTGNSTTFNSTYPLTLFGMNSGGTIDSRRAIGKLYSAVIYDNGTVVRDLVPVYRISDNVIGLYDRVNDVFYINSGTGSFTKANSIN